MLGVLVSLPDGGRAAPPGQADSHAFAVVVAIGVVPTIFVLITSTLWTTRRPGRAPALRAERSIVIRRPTSEVYAILNDPTALLLLWPNVLRIEPTSPGPLGVGSTARVTLRMAGKIRTLEGPCVAYRPERLFAMQTRVGWRLATSRVAFEPVAEGTRVTSAVAISIRPTMILDRPLRGRRAGRALEATLDRMKRYAEDNLPA